MQDDAAAEAPARGKGKKAGGGKGGGAKKAAKAEAKAAGVKNPEVQIARMLVRAQWLQEWNGANPDASQADRKAAWKDARAGKLEQDLKSARKVIGLLQRQGVSMTLTAAAEAADVEADAGDDDAA